MTKKEQYIQLRVAGKTRKEVREIMGYTKKAESTYAARLAEEIENRKRLRELPPDARLDGTPKLTPADAERKIAETLGLVEYATGSPLETENPVSITPPPALLPEINPPRAECAPGPKPAGPVINLVTVRGLDALTIHGDYCDYLIRIEVQPTRLSGIFGSPGELGQKIAAEMAAVEQLLREAIPC